MSAPTPLNLADHYRRLLASTRDPLAVTSGRVVALEGPSASGKTTLARRLGTSLDAVVIGEAYWALRPRPSLHFSSGAALERLERLLLTAEADRWIRATRAAASGRTVVLDTGTLGPLTYTYGLWKEGEAPPGAFRALLPYARRLARSGVLGLPSVTVYLDVPLKERTRRARETPREHPAELFPCHQRVARQERNLLLGPWRKELRVHRIRIAPGSSVSKVVRRIRGYLRTAPRVSPTTRVGDRDRVLGLLRRLERER